jgi:hypothetical protein
MFAGIDPASAAKQLSHGSEIFLRIYLEWIEEYSKNSVKTRIVNGGPDGTRTRDLRRDRPAF